MPPPGRGRGRGRGHPGPHRPHHPHPAPHRPHPAPHRPHPAPHRPGPVAAAVGAAVAAAAAPAAPKVVFERLYHFAVSRDVYVQHALGKNLRVHAANDTLGYEGGFGEFARWKCHLHEQGRVIQLQSVKTGKFLRVRPDGNDFDVQGVPKGKFTYFILEKLSTGVVHMKSRETFHGGKHAYLAVMHGQIPQKRLTFFIEGLPREWEKTYLFAAKNMCLIQHTGFENLRSNADGVVEPNGKSGDAAQWEVMPDHNTGTVQLRSKKHGGYLRIHDDGKVVDAKGKGGKFTVFKVHHIGGEKNYVKLESVVSPGKFIAVDDKGVRVGVGGKFCALTFYKE